MRIFSIIFSSLLLLSCSNEQLSEIRKSEKVPLSVAENFTMIYTDSTVVKSYISGKTHFDFSNDILNYSEL